MTDTQHGTTRQGGAPGPADDALELLQALFHDKPRLLNVVTLGDLEGQGVVNEVRSHAQLFGQPVYQFTVGRTQAGKSTLGNLLFGTDVMKVTGRQDCTGEIGMLPMRSDLYFFDSPGAGNAEEYENFSRLALGLPQIDDGEVSSFELWDFGRARREGDTTVGVQKRVITADTWEEEFAVRYPPDVMVYVVDARKGFIRPDRQYLRDILRRYGDKVVVALNWFDGDTARAQVDEVRGLIGQVYEGVFKDGSAKPRFVEFNALTGSGVQDLTRQLCRVIPPEKLGGIEAVLDGDLKQEARGERGLNYRRTVHRIAARLALNTVDKDLGGRNLIAIAASGISQFGVLTFEAEAAATALRGELAELAEREADSVREQRTETLFSEKPEIKKRDIEVNEPRFETEIVEKARKHKVSRQVEEVTGKGLWEVVKGYGRAAYDEYIDGVETPGGWLKKGRDNSVNRTTKTVEDEFEIMVPEARQKLAGYVKRVVATVDEVVGTTVREVGKKPHEGGLPAIELLLSVGAGVEAYCLADGERQSADVYVAQARQRVELALDRAKPRLEKLLKQGHEAEDEIALVLDGLFAAQDSGKGPAS